MMTRISGDRLATENQHSELASPDNNREYYGDIMEKKKYSEKLKDPRWQKKRLEILQRDNWTCQYCGATEKTLHVHHLQYSGINPWETNEINLITACEDCHDYESSARGEWERLLVNSMRTIGLSADDILKFHVYVESSLNHGKKEQTRLLIKEFIELLGK